MVLATIFAIPGGGCLPKVEVNTEKIRRKRRMPVMSMEDCSLFQAHSLLLPFRKRSLQVLVGLLVTKQRRHFPTSLQPRAKACTSSHFRKLLGEFPSGTA